MRELPLLPGKALVQFPVFPGSMPIHCSTWKVYTQMDTATIIKAIDAELEILGRVRNILGGDEAFFSASHAVLKPKRKKRVLSAEARAKISAAQKRRWAKQKKAAKATA